MIEMSESASKYIQKCRIEEGHGDGVGLRISVSGGGCSGLSYQLEFEKEPHADDVVAEQAGLRFWVDPKSMMFLKGMKLDYESKLSGAGLKFENPNAKRSCGCGSSFSA